MKINKFESSRDGHGNNLFIGSDFREIRSWIDFREGDNTVHIGNNCILDGAEIILGRRGKLIIEDGSTIRGSIKIGFNSIVVLGQGFHVENRVTIHAVECTKIEIGADCLFGSDIVVRSTDGHPIYDALTGERLNQSKSVKIGRHVWIGDRVIILKGVEIGDAVVVGAGSIVTKGIPANSLAVGVPATVVRSRVTWELGSGKRTPEFYLDHIDN